MNAICWAFYCVNDGKDLDGGSPQIFKMYVFLHQSCACSYSKHKRKKKGLITYYETYGITTLKKHVDANHFLIFKKNKKEINY